jgi:hypothetical protein
MKSLVGLCQGSDILVNDSNISDFLSISRELENSELYSILEEHISGESITLENVVSRYVGRKSICVSYQDEIDFISSHFCEIDKSKFAEFDVLDLHDILSNPSLCVESEDWLFDFIEMRGFEEFFELFGFVRFEFLSIDRIRKFCEQSQDKSPSSLIWCSLCRRLILPVDTSGVSRDMSRYGSNCPFKPSDPLSGIISYLTMKHRGNVSDTKVVKVTASSVNGGWVAKNVADLTDDTNWYSDNEDNSWVCYDFKNMQIKPTHYSIRSRYDGRTDSYYPRSWFVEVSNDGSTWQMIDERRDNSELKGRDLTQTFAVSASDYYQLIRIRHQGPNWYSTNTDYHFVISSFEIFGDLRE